MRRVKGNEPISGQIVLPFEEQPHYTENIVHLPDCYMNDRKRTISSCTPTRRELGLPAEGFVFCCFNNNWEVHVGNVRRLDAAIKGSQGKRALAISRDNGNAETNLRKEAAARGIDPTLAVVWALYGSVSKNKSAKRCRAK
jgi:protein O-GlcNAc transferase